jgi:RHS repeat-associated protein
MQSPPENWAYLYTADDERLWSYDLARGLSHWTVRDLGAKVLRDYLNMGGTWSVATDYIYRDGLLLAAETQTGQRHFHLDHLGTPRLITRAGGEKVAYHVYYPFGEEATVYNQDAERMKFTGHERDLANPGVPGDDLDYMHARHESPVTGRFLSVDPAGESFDPQSPQSWNRYSYVHDSPIIAIDPSGKVVIFYGTQDEFRKLESIVNQGLRGVRLVIDNNGRASLVATGDSGPPSPEQSALANILGSAISNRQTIGIGLVSGDSGVMVGSYNTRQIDVGDLAAVGRGPAASGFSLFTHELTEQVLKQTNGLANATPGNDQQYRAAHASAIAAQSAVSGFQVGPMSRNLHDGTGTTTTPYVRGNQTITVTITWSNGNIVRVQRQ